MQGISDLVVASSQFSKAYQSYISKVAEKHNLSIIEVDVLLFLANNPLFDTAKDIVQYRRIGKSYVSKAVDLLLNKKLLSAIIDSNDRRITHLKINESAINIIKDGQAAQHSFIDVLHQNISEEELKQLDSLISKMNDNISKII